MTTFSTILTAMCVLGASGLVYMMARLPAELRKHTVQPATQPGTALEVPQIVTRDAQVQVVPARGDVVPAGPAAREALIETARLETGR